MRESTAQEPPNTAWASVLVKQLEEKLFIVLVGGTERRGSEFNVQQNLAHGTGSQAAALLSALAKTVQWRVGDFNAQGGSCKELREAERRVSDCNAQALATRHGRLQR